MEIRKVRSLIIAFLLVVLILLAACTFGGNDGGANNDGDLNSDGGSNGEVENKNLPGTPVFSQHVTDCVTGDQVVPNTLIQPDPGCDSWETNRYERPFNAGSQDVFYPEVDIHFGELGKDSNWFYLSLVLFGPPQDGKTYQGSYGVEIDVDQDGRGDFLILQSPGSEGVGVWTKAVQGEGSDPDAVWVRVVYGENTYIDIAFKPSMIENAEVFKWWVWADVGGADRASFDYNDAITNEDAGDAYESFPYFPVNMVFGVDNTCAELWGEKAPADDPSFCVNDPYIPGNIPPVRPTPTPTSTSTPGLIPPVSRTETPTETPFLPGPPVPQDSETPSPTPTDTPTPLPTAPPPLICKKNFRTKNQCVAAGGTWVQPNDAKPYCNCP